ncbi:hypothetical protein V6N12_007842 [Hibiscus sabdariffa]|uniref:Uncharacterized protein n=1 Tax=Hibiscus sabdariffa TaxID=183260 RepID=A0ABR2F2X0_9ROSI
MPVILMMVGGFWAGGSAAAGGSGVGSNERSSQMIRATGASHFRAMGDSAKATGGVALEEYCTSSVSPAPVGTDGIHQCAAEK